MTLRLRVVRLEPGGRRAFDPAEWQGALVLLARGQLELEGVTGARRHFERGAVLHFTGVPLRALRNRGREPALLIAAARAPRAAPRT